MRKIILIILSFMIFLSCRGTVTSPNNIDNNGNTTEPPITEEDIKKAGVDPALRAEALDVEAFVRLARINA